MNIEYQERTIEKIFQHFVDGFELAPGLSISSFETNYDPHTGKVIFKLYIEGVEKEKP